MMHWKWLPKVNLTRRFSLQHNSTSQFSLTCAKVIVSLQPGQSPDPGVPGCRVRSGSASAAVRPAIAVVSNYGSSDNIRGDGQSHGDGHRGGHGGGHGGFPSSPTLSDSRVVTTKNGRVAVALQKKTPDQLMRRYQEQVRTATRRPSPSLTGSALSLSLCRWTAKP